MNKLLLTLLAAFALAFAGYSQTNGTVVSTGTITGNQNGLIHATADFLHFLQPDPSNGIAQAEEFDVDVLGKLTHVTDSAGKEHREFGADLAVSYFFTTGLGSRFDISYANGQAQYTSLSGIARTTFGSTNNAFMVIPYTVVIAQHGIGDGNSDFKAGVGIGIEVPFHIKSVQARAKVEFDSFDRQKPDILFGLNFSWKRF